MKTLNELEQENAILRQKIEDLKEMNQYWQKLISDFRNTILQYQRELRIPEGRTLRIVR